MIRLPRPAVLLSGVVLIGAVLSGPALGAPASERRTDASTRSIDADCGALGHLVGRVHRDTPARATLLLTVRGGPPRHRLTLRVTQPGREGYLEWYPRLDDHGDNTEGGHRRAVRGER